MKTLEFGEFQMLCDQQGVTMHEDLAQLRPPSDQVDYKCYSPTSMLKAVVVAGRLLSEGRKALADGPIELDDSLLEDTATRSLAGIINSSLGDEDATKLSQPNFQRAALPGIWACRLAEHRFGATKEKLESNSGSCQIIGDDQPLFLRKTDVQPSALSLAEVSVEGVIYPPGSIFRVELLSEPPLRKITKNEDRGIQSIPVDQVLGATFMRLATLGLEPHERNFKFTDVISFYFKFLRGAKQQTVRTVTIEDFVGTVSSVFEPQNQAREMSVVV